MAQEQILFTGILCLFMLLLGGFIFMVIEGEALSIRRWTLAWWFRLAAILLVSLPILIMIAGGLKSIINITLG